jgi:hypothetical protein
MFSLLGPRGRLCDSWSKQGAGFGAADSVIFIYLQGSPSHIDLWDPKPDAPAEIRGEFKPIATKASGVFVGEVLPMLSEQADKFTIVRSIGVANMILRNHGALQYMLLTGHDPQNFSPTGLALPPSREDLPAVGAVAAKFRPAEQGNLSYAAVCGPVMEGSVVGLAQAAGVLGAAHDPFTVYQDATQPIKLEEFSLPAEIPLGRFAARAELWNATGRSLETPAAKTYDAYHDKALALIQSQRVSQAFALESEAASVRERYGMTRFGQSCLLARRLIEAGTRFVQVTWPARSDDEPAAGPDGSWDTHRNNFPMLREHRCPVFDRSLSALIADMADRGLLARTLVVAIGEFGRSPKIGAPTTDNVGPGGRDHWPECYSFLIAGGGVQPGRAFGESDKFGAYPKTAAMHPYDLVSTLHHALGIDPAQHYQDHLNRPRRLVQKGRPVVELF